MQKVENILELLKKAPLSVEELGKKGKLSTEDVATIVNFLKQQLLIEERNKRYHVTEVGLQLLRLDSPETAVHSLYAQKAKKASVKEREEMADRFCVETGDVDHAAWVLAKDIIGAKLERDCAEKKREGKEK